MTPYTLNFQKWSLSTKCSLESYSEHSKMYSLILAKKIKNTQMDFTLIYSKEIRSVKGDFIKWCARMSIIMLCKQIKLIYQLQRICLTEMFWINHYYINLHYHDTADDNDNTYNYKCNSHNSPNNSNVEKDVVIQMMMMMMMMMRRRRRRRTKKVLYYYYVNKLPNYNTPN